MAELNLGEGEQILYECHGKLKHVLLKLKSSGGFKFTQGAPLQILMRSGKFFITNKRIVGQGELTVGGGRKDLGGFPLIGLLTWGATGGSRRKELRAELPRDVYEIPIENLSKIKKFRGNLHYEVRTGTYPGTGVIKPSRASGEEAVERIFEILSQFDGVETSMHKRVNDLFISLCCLIIIVFIVIAVV